MIDIVIEENSTSDLSFSLASLLHCMTKWLIWGGNYEFEAGLLEISTIYSIELKTHFSIKVLSFYAISNRWYLHILPESSKKMPPFTLNHLWYEQKFNWFYSSMFVAFLNFNQVSYFQSLSIHLSSSHLSIYSSLSSYY